MITISGLTYAASAPALLRFALRVAARAQGWLPAGWLAFTGRASNPLDRYERFQIVVILLSSSPDATFPCIDVRGRPPQHSRYSRNQTADGQGRAKRGDDPCRRLFSSIMAITWWTTSTRNASRSSVAFAAVRLGAAATHSSTR